MFNQKMWSALLLVCTLSVAACKAPSVTLNPVLSEQESARLEQLGLLSSVARDSQAVWSPKGNRVAVHRVFQKTVTTPGENNQAATTATTTTDRIWVFEKDGTLHQIYDLPLPANAVAATYTPDNVLLSWSSDENTLYVLQELYQATAGGDVANTNTGQTPANPVNPAERNLTTLTLKTLNVSGAASTTLQGPTSENTFAIPDELKTGASAFNMASVSPDGQKVALYRRLTAAAAASPEPETSASPEASASPVPEGSASADPSASPTPEATSEPTASPQTVDMQVLQAQASPTATPSATATPTPVPAGPAMAEILVLSSSASGTPAETWGTVLPDIQRLAWTTDGSGLLHAATFNEAPGLYLFSAQVPELKLPLDTLPSTVVFSPTRSRALLTLPEAAADSYLWIQFDPQMTQPLSIPNLSSFMWTHDHQLLQGVPVNSEQMRLQSLKKIGPGQNKEVLRLDDFEKQLETKYKILLDEKKSLIRKDQSHVTVTTLDYQQAVLRGQHSDTYGLGFQDLSPVSALAKEYQLVPDVDESQIRNYQVLAHSPTEPIVLVMSHSASPLVHPEIPLFHTFNLETQTLTPLAQTYQEMAN